MDSTERALGAVIVGVAVWPWLGDARDVGFALLPLFVVVALRWRHAAMIVGLLLGIALGASVPEGPTLEGPVVVQGRVLSGASGARAELEVSRHSRPGGLWEEVSGRVVAKFPDGAPGTGSWVVLWGVASALADEAVLPGEPDPVRAARRSGAVSQVKVGRWRPIGGDPGPAVAVPGPHGGVLRALALGDRSAMDPELSALMRRTGTFHLLSISGSHVAMVAGGVALLLRPVARWLARFRRQGLAPTWADLAGVSVALFYAVATGFPVPAQRAAVMLFLGALGRHTGRLVRPVRILLVAAILVLWFDPAALGSATFQLSFGAVWGLVVFAKPWAGVVPPDAPGWVRAVTGALATTFAATYGTLPATLWWFQALPPTSPLANLVAVPIVGWVVCPAAFGACLLPEPLAGWAALVGNVAMEFVVWSLRWLDAEPWALAVGPVGALALLAPMLVWRRYGWGLLFAVAVVMGPGRSAPSHLRATVLDIGQGLSVFVEEPDGRTFLVDGGPSDEAVARWLRREGVSRIDVVVVSHGHKDHTEGLEEVLRGFEVGELWVGDLDGIGPLLVAAAERGVSVRSDPPGTQRGARGRAFEANDRSLVLGFGPPGRRLLLPGDLEAAGEAGLVGLIDEAAVLVAGHHGSRTSSSEPWLEAIDPQIAVSSSARNHRFRHPHDEVVDRFAARGVPLVRTDVGGTLELNFEPLGLRIRSHRAGRGWVDQGTVPWRGSADGPARRSSAGGGELAAAVLSAAFGGRVVEQRPGLAVAHGLQSVGLDVLLDQKPHDGLGPGLSEAEVEAVRALGVAVAGHLQSDRRLGRELGQDPVESGPGQGSFGG